MMSTITDEEAILTVLSPTVQVSVIEAMIEMDGFRRLAFMGEGGEPVGCPHRRCMTLRIDLLQIHGRGS